MQVTNIDSICFFNRECLSDVFHQVVDVNVLDSNDPVNLGLLSRPELGVTFTKVHCWRLTQFTKCVFMDADMVVGFLSYL